MSFFSTMGQEMAARRRRLRSAFGDRGQALVEFSVMGGLLAGSLGLLIAPWMARTAPWGFALPFVYAAGFFFIEVRRQRALSRGDDAARVTSAADWTLFLWSFGCALLGAAAFVVAWSAQPRAPEPEWHPPANTVPADITTSGRPPIP